MIIVKKNDIRDILKLEAVLTMTIPGICRTVSVMTAMFVLVVACSPRNDAEIRIEKNFVGEVRLDEIYDEISFVPLRFAESAPVANVYQSVVAEGKIFLNTNSTIVEYSMDGDFIRSVGHRGRGPGEYANINSFYVADGYVYILDWNRKLVKYSVDGEFVREMRLDWFAGSVFARDGRLVITSGYQNPGDLFNVFDAESFEPETSFQLVNENRFSYRQFMFPNCFALYGEDVIYYEELSNEVYSLDLDKGTADVRYSFDLLGKNPPEGYWDRRFGSIIDLLEDINVNGYNRGFSRYQESDRQIFFTFSTTDADSPLQGNLYDKRSGESRQFTRVIIDDDIPPVSLRDIYFGYSTDTICMILPESAFFDEDGRQYTERLFPPYEPDGNPVAIIARLK